MKKALKKSPVIAFAEVLYQRAAEICTAANDGEDPEIIIKAWEGSLEEEIKRVTGSLETVIIMERPEIVPDKLSKGGKNTANGMSPLRATLFWMATAGTPMTLPTSSRRAFTNGAAIMPG